MEVSPEIFVEQFKKAGNPLGKIQQEAIESFKKAGIPHVKLEEFRHTNIVPAFAKNFSFEQKEHTYSAESLIKKLPVSSIENTVIIENGELSKVLPTASGIEVVSLNKNTSHQQFEKHFSKYADLKSDSLAALNTAMAKSCILVGIAANQQVEKPLNIVLISSATDQASFIPVRLLFLADKNSSTLVHLFQISASENGETLTSIVTEAFTDENARLEVEYIQQENNKSNTLSNTYVESAANSFFKIHTITLGGVLVRNKLRIRLNGQGSEAYFNGLYLPDDRMHVDNYTNVIHAVPNCTSNQTYRGVISDEAHGVFCGRIVVEQDAQKTQAYQSNKNILVGNHAMVNSKPQLEIYADDVKCTHGATTGRLDSNALFYLRARGINEQRARALLITAFASDVLQQTTDPALHQFLIEQITLKLSVNNLCK
ncbi:MAG: Fe-S cluster assembly protein SufD [Bacteroidia bacterium]|nr:Fe-S cluster assembly protein SufD [Bacteroidia bacterium]MCZ2276391.1 Fe-S cluster assembly protein SufD [Bacteroidia bacterium]